MIRKLSFYILIAVFLGCLPLLLKYGFVIYHSDFSMQQIPFIIETKRMLLSGTPFWTWNNYFGDNFIGAFSFYTLTSPFVWLNCLFPDEYMLYGITFTYFLKFICCGLVAYAYFRKIHFSEELSMIGALLYSLSSFAILNMMYYHFMEPMICFPIFMIALENYIEGGKYKMVLLAASTFLVAFINFYFLPCTMIAGAIYFMCRLYFCEYENKVKTLVVAIALVTLGVMLSAFILLPIMMYMHGAPREDLQFGFDILEMVERLRVLFVPRLVEGTNSFTLNRVCFNSNLIALPIVGCFFVYLYMKRNRDWIFWLLAISLFFYLTPLNGIFCLFTNPGYTRWGYALTLFLIIPTLKILDSNSYSVSEYKLYFIKAIALIIAISLFCVIYKYLVLKINISFKSLGFYVLEFLFMLLHAIFMYYYAKKRNINRLCIYIVIASSIQLTMLFFSRNGKIGQMSSGVNKYEYLYEKYLLDNDYAVNEYSTFYRHDYYGAKNTHASGNVALAKNIPSVRTYNSCKNNAGRMLMLTTDSLNLKMNWFVPRHNRTSFDALMSVKTVVDYKDPYPDTVRIEGLSRIKSTEKYDVYDFKYYVPMGFTYDSYVCEDMLNDSLINDKPLQMLANICVNKEDKLSFEKYLKQGHIDNAYSIDSVCCERAKHVCKWVKTDTRGFSACADMDKDYFVFFSVPADPGFKAYVDKNEAKIYNVNLGMSAIFVPKGKHNIRFDYFPPGLKEGSWVTSFALVLLFFLFVYERIQNRKESTYID